MEAQATVDARGLLCPQPLLLARQRLAGLSAGEVVEVVATDPHAELDFEVFCVRSGHQLLARSHAGGEWRFWIRKRADED